MNLSLPPLDDNQDSVILTRASFEGHPCPKSFYARHGKRVMDLISSAIGLLLLSPLLGFVMLGIKLSSPGSVFYRQIRLGKHGREFAILKFRSMRIAACYIPPGLTVSGDKRITGFGKFLRRYKFDELPQLWNVLKGEMSLVGPRPELKKFVLNYSSEQQKVLCVRPGITDPASLAYRNEEEILSHSVDPERTYVTQILPDKLAQSLSYIEKISFYSDLRILVLTLKSLLASATSRGSCRTDIK